MIQVLVTTLAISRAKCQSNRRHQHAIFLQAGCPSCRPTNSVKALKGKISHCMGLLTPSSPGVFQLCLWPPIAPGYLGGGLPCLSSALCDIPNRVLAALAIHLAMLSSTATSQCRWSSTAVSESRSSESVRKIWEWNSSVHLDWCAVAVCCRVQMKMLKMIPVDKLMTLMKKTTASVKQSGEQNDWSGKSS